VLSSVTDVMKKVVIFAIAVALNGCSDSGTQPQAPEGFILTTDRSSYHFSYNGVWDTLQLTLLNATDSTIQYWWPSYLQLSTDSGWQILDIACGGFHDPPLPPYHKVTKSWFVITDSNAHFPEGTYRLLAELSVDSLTYLRLVPSNSFRMAYK